MSDLKIMQVEPCKATGKLYSHPSEFRHRLNSYREPSMLRIAEHALSELEAVRKLDIATHEKNVLALENNRLVVDHLTAVNVALGMPDGWSARDPNSRARIPKTIRYPAGWRQDIAQHVRTSDGFDTATSTYERLLATYTEYKKQADRDDEQKKGAAARAEAEKLAKRKADLEFVQICQRYELPLESEWSDVLDDLRKRDQRLDLAIAMVDVRGDWNDGCSAVEYALSRFTIRNDEDKDIANDVLGCTHDFEDGRVFRDTTWNYDRLFASVQDRQLVADVEMAKSQCRDAS
jgi:hypothetical protein